LFAASLVAADASRVYVYAQSGTHARSWLPIFCGGAAVAEIQQGTFFAADLPPGKYTVNTKFGIPAFVDLRAGGEAFVRLDWNIQSPGATAIATLHNVPAETARKEMANLVYIDRRRILSSSVSRTDPRGPIELRLKRRQDR